MKHDAVTPYDKSDEKNKQVAEMFNNIAHRYDLLNTLLSAGIHKGWRKKCVELLREEKPRAILDVATGTGDFAIECSSLRPEKIIGIDISEGMLQIGRKKIREQKLSDLISLKSGNAETIALPDNYFDAIVVGFGVRNFEDLEKGLLNLMRLLRPNGTLVILEFSYPQNRLIRTLYDFYFSFITPFIGRLFSKDRRAYSYLTESVKAFPHNRDFLAILERTGFHSTTFKPLTMGVAAIYTGKKAGVRSI